jgi:predicted MPP superfamily phosphohydrolase
MRNLTRRGFLKFASLSLLSILGGITGSLVIFNETDQLEVFTVHLPIKNLPAGLEGFKILQMTDFHLLPYTQPELIREAVRRCNQLQPDLVALTGDYVWLEVEAAFELAEILSGLDARHGVYAVLGNHDYWEGIDTVLAGLDRHRLPVLKNQGFPISAKTGGLYIAGLDDGWAGRPDLEAALERAPAGYPVVLLYHEPDLAEGIAKDGRIALQLSGHSHGGQVRIPGVGPMILPYLARRYDYHLYRLDQMWLYTNGGMGTISVPVRYRCPPEITELILVRA